MPSARSQALNFLTRILTRIAYRKPQEVGAYRERFAARDAKSDPSLPAGYTTQDQSEPVEGRWVRGPVETQRVLLYLHGGAFVLRLPNTHTAFAAKMCAELGMSAFLPWYRLAPEHPFPAAPQDCLAAYRSLLESGVAAHDIVLMGDSAGANLVLSALHLIHRAELAMPAAAVALSPITDFAQISATWRLNKWRDPMYVVQGAVAPQRYYLQGASPVDPVASPYYGSLDGFPPCLLVVGGVEALMDDTIGFARKAVESDVAARVHIWNGMPHVFPLYDFIPETALARRQIVDWLRALDRAPADPKRLHESCVEVFNRTAVRGRLERETNDVYFAGA